MPEEINRILIDSMPDCLCITERSGLNNLKHEGIPKNKVHFVGHVMIDSLINYIPNINDGVLERFGVEGIEQINKSVEIKVQSNESKEFYAMHHAQSTARFILVTMHRPSSVDFKNKLSDLIEMLNRLSEKRKIIFPIHPRTKQNIEKFGLDEKLNHNLILTDPVGYIDFIALIKNAEVILTDSGGIQEESTYLDVQCVTLRNSTERPITVEIGTIHLVGDDFVEAERVVNEILSGKKKKGKIPELWDGKASDRILEILILKVWSNINYMKILVVCSGNAGFISPFVKEQVEAIVKLGNEVVIYPIVGKGFFGYLKNLPGIKRKIKEFSPDLIHAHYGLSGLLSCLQRKVPVVVTFHNGEILSKRTNFLSSLVIPLSQYNIYVAEHIRKTMFLKKSKNYSIIPCGIDLQTIKLIEQSIARNHSLINSKKINILFGGAFDNERKNYALAKKAISLLNEYDINLIELKGLDRKEVCQLLNACEFAFLPSKSEGSPQFIKEAMACNCPIVATNVGDIKEIVAGTKGCYITSFDSEDVANKIRLALNFGKRTDGREKINSFSNELIAKKIIYIYELLNKDKINQLRTTLYD